MGKTVGGYSWSEKDGENGIKRYGAVVLKRSLTSTRSPFYYKYKKYYTKINSFYQSNTSLTHKEITRCLENLAIEEYESDNTWEKLEYIDKQLDDMYWYDRDVFKLYYYDGNTLDSLAKKTKISRQKRANDAQVSSKRNLEALCGRCRAPKEPPRDPREPPKGAQESPKTLSKPSLDRK